MQTIETIKLCIRYNARTVGFRTLTYPQDQFTAPEWARVLKTMTTYMACGGWYGPFDAKVDFRLLFQNRFFGPREYSLRGIFAPEAFDLREGLARTDDSTVEVFEDGQCILRSRVKSRIKPDKLDAQIAQAGGY